MKQKTVVLVNTMKRIHKKVETNSAGETVRIGELIGKLLNPGDIVCLEGDLGTGKTAMTQGIAQALGIDGRITSPTFTIVNEYYGRLKMYHFDVYRVNDPEELYDIGFEEYIYDQAVVVIEWSDLIKDMISEENIWVKISKEPDFGENTRVIDIYFNGEKYKDRDVDELLQV